MNFAFHICVLLSKIDLPEVGGNYSASVNSASGIIKWNVVFGKSKKQPQHVNKDIETSSKN